MNVVWRLLVHIAQTVVGTLVDGVSERLGRRDAMSSSPPRLTEGPGRKPPRGCFRTVNDGVAWIFSSALRFALISCLPLAFMWANRSKDSATVEWHNALMGTNNSKCSGELTDAQATLCNQYFATLSRWYLTIWALNACAVVWSDIKLTIAGGWKFVTDSTLGWSVYIGLFIAIVWLVVRVVAWLANRGTELANRSGIFSYDREQELRFQQLVARAPQIVEHIPMQGVARHRDTLHVHD
jgi:hypothetical protein